MTVVNKSAHAPLSGVGGRPPDNLENKSDRVGLHGGNVIEGFKRNGNFFRDVMSILGSDAIRNLEIDVKWFQSLMARIQTPVEPWISWSCAPNLAGAELRLSHQKTAPVRFAGRLSSTFHYPRTPEGTLRPEEEIRQGAAERRARIARRGEVVKALQIEGLLPAANPQPSRVSEESANAHSLARRLGLDLT